MKNNRETKLIMEKILLHLFDVYPNLKKIHANNSQKHNDNIYREFFKLKDSNGNNVSQILKKHLGNVKYDNDVIHPIEDSQNWIGYYEYLEDQNQRMLQVVFDLLNIDMDHVLYDLVHFPKFEGKNTISYFESALKGACGIRKTISLTRYLSKYFAKSYRLSPTAIDRAVRLAKKIDKVKFARSVKAIEHVYLNGPDSCMAIGYSDYEGIASGKRMPVAAYAAGDLAIAYLENEDEEIVARVLCWPEKKKYIGSFYASYDEYSDILRDKLDSLGFRESHDFCGALIAKYYSGKVEFSGDGKAGKFLKGWILPCFDANFKLIDYDDKNFIIIKNNEANYRYICYSDYGSTPQIGFRNRGFIDDDDRIFFNDDVKNLDYQFSKNDKLIIVKNSSSDFKKLLKEDNHFYCHGIRIWVSKKHNKCIVVDGKTFSEEMGNNKLSLKAKKSTPKKLAIAA